MLLPEKKHKFANITSKFKILWRLSLAFRDRFTNLNFVFQAFLPWPSVIPWVSSLGLTHPNAWIRTEIIHDLLFLYMLFLPPGIASPIFNSSNFCLYWCLTTAQQIIPHISGMNNKVSVWEIWKKLRYRVLVWGLSEIVVKLLARLQLSWDLPGMEELLPSLFTWLLGGSIPHWLLVLGQNSLWTGPLHRAAWIFWHCVIWLPQMSEREERDGGDESRERREKRGRGERKKKRKRSWEKVQYGSMLSYVYHKDLL